MSSPPLAGNSQSLAARSPRSPTIQLSSSPRRLPVLGSRIIPGTSPRGSPNPQPETDMNPAAAASPVTATIEDDDDANTETADMPLTLAASVILTNLPGDAKEALKNATGPAGGNASDIPAKVTIRVHALGSSPQLKQQLFMLSSSSAFSTVLRLLRKKLGLKPHEGLHCYIGQSFSPALDEEVAGLWKCFKTPGLKTPFELVVQYALSPTFG